MNTFLLLISLSLGLAVGLIVHSGLEALRATLARSPAPSILGKVGHRRMARPNLESLSFILLALIALVRGGWLAALWFLGMGLWRNTSRREKESQEDLEAVRRFVELFISRQAVFSAPIRAMKEAADLLPPERFPRPLVEKAYAAYSVQGTEEAFFNVLSEWPWPSWKMFVTQVSSLTRGDEETRKEGLRELAKFFTKKAELVSEVQISLTASKITATALRWANLAAFFLAIVSPIWSDFFLASWSRQLLLCLFHAMMLSGNLYFEAQQAFLSRRTL